MPEVCSSGLSHTHADYFPSPYGNFPFVTDNAVLDSEIFMDLNYGVLDVKKAKKDAEIVLKASIRDIDGYEVISKEYKKQDFVFDAENLLNSELCFDRAAKQLNFKIMSQNFTKIFFDNDIDTTMRVFGAILGSVALSLALFIQVSVFLLRLCKISKSTASNIFDE